VDYTAFILSICKSGQEQEGRSILMEMGEAPAHNFYIIWAWWSYAVWIWLFSVMSVSIEPYGSQILYL